MQAIVKVKFMSSCPAICNPMDYTVHGILQARILEWVAIPLERNLKNYFFPEFWSVFKFFLKYFDSKLVYITG